MQLTCLCVSHLIFFVVSQDGISCLPPKSPISEGDNAPPEWFKAYEKARRLERAQDMEVRKQERAQDMEVRKQERAQDMEVRKQERKEDRDFLYALIKKRDHDVHHEVAMALESATFSITQSVGKTNYVASGHDIFYSDHFFKLSVAHVPHGVNETSFICPDIDVQIFFDCPKNNAINATGHTALRIGDTASTFGYINLGNNSVARYWTGVLAGQLGARMMDKNTNTTFLAEEYLFGSVAELFGMSGGPTANGKGYTGIVHGNYMEKNSVQMAIVLPFSIVLSRCISVLLLNTTYSSLLKRPDQCPDAKVTEVPQF